MNKISLFIILFSIALSAQTRKIPNNFFSPENIKGFGDHLFCTHDYLRAVEEYRRYLKTDSDDTVKYKIGTAYLRMGYYNEAASSFQSVFNSPELGNYARLNYLKSLFLTNDYKDYRSIFNRLESGIGNEYLSNALALYNYSYLFTGEKMPDEKSFLKPFNDSDKKTLSLFYNEKINPDYKSPVTAAILSAIIPGAGKFYTHEYADGITAFITVGILGYIAYTDFQADHKFRAWLFTGLTAGFYAGNVYGAAASAQIFNAKIKFDFTETLKNYLEKVNYFISDIRLCN